MASTPLSLQGGPDEQRDQVLQLAAASVAIRSLASMLGRSLDDIHPYGIRVATGGRKPSPEVVRALEEATRKIEPLFEQFLDETSTAAMRRRRQNGARGAKAKQHSERAS